MEKLKTVTKLLYEHSLVRYILVGGTTFVLDLGLLVLLHGVWDVNLVVATTIAYWAAITFNFTTNRFWAFQKRENAQLAKHLTFYLILLGANYLYTVLFISGAVALGMNYGVAKIVAVLLQTTWTYVLYKKVVFN